MAPMYAVRFQDEKESNIKQHRADKHDVGVTWHACTELVCEYRAKREREQPEATQSSGT